MSKLRKKIEELKEGRAELLAGRWENIKTSITKWKAQVAAINEELKNTSYKPRRHELFAQRKEILKQAREFFNKEYEEQRRIYHGYKVQFNKMIAINDKELSSVDLMNIDHSKHNTQWIKDVINSATREQIEDMFEDACFDGDAERARLIQMYSIAKFKAEYDDSKKKDGTNRMEVVENSEIRRANEAATSISRIQQLVDVASRCERGISTGRWTSIDSADEFVRGIWDEMDPWANQELGEED